jgi:hypothetical protein
LVFVDRIVEVRMGVMKQLLAVAHTKLNQYLQSKETLCRSDWHNARPEDCDVIMLGSFIRGLQSMDVLPQSGNKIHLNIIRMSIEEFAHKLIHMIVKSPHSQCSVSPLRAEILEALRAIPDPTLDSHRRHMEAQRGNGTMG